MQNIYTTCKIFSDKIYWFCIKCIFKHKLKKNILDNKYLFLEIHNI